MTERDLAEWDRQIEEDFQRCMVAPMREAGKHKRGQRLLGAPIAFVAEVCRQTEGRATLLIALLIYRRTKVCKNQTVTLPGEELTAVGIDRRRKSEALAALKAANFIRLVKANGRSTRVTLLWRPPSSP